MQSEPVLFRPEAKLLHEPRRSRCEVKLLCVWCREFPKLNVAVAFISPKVTPLLFPCYQSIYVCWPFQLLHGEHEIACFHRST